MRVKGTIGIKIFSSTEYIVHAVVVGLLLPNIYRNLIFDLN